MQNRRDSRDYDLRQMLAYATCREEKHGGVEKERHLWVHGRRTCLLHVPMTSTMQGFQRAFDNLTGYHAMMAWINRRMTQDV